MSDLALALGIESLRTTLAGRYAVERELGSGGMAVVFQARDERHHRSVAIKVLRPELATLVGPGRFLREIEIGSRLQHPHILPVLDSGEAGGLPYYVMPLVEGESLRDRLVRAGPLTLEETTRIAAEVGDALAYAHEKGIVHRDIKPENILLSSGHAVVTDFGIARAVLEAGGERVTSSGLVLGTPAYMSPEQAGGEARLDGRADEYALGCVIYEMLVGEPPFAGPSAQAVLARHAHERPPSISVVRPGVPEHVVAAVERALSKVPADRFDTVSALVTALTVPGVPFRARPVHRRRAWAAALAMLALVSVTVWFVIGPEPRTADPYKVVVFPLLERGLADADSGAGYDVALAVQSALEHAEPLRGLDGWRGLSAAQRADARLLTLRSARGATRRMGARWFIDGAVRAVGDSVAVVLRLYDAAADSDVAQQTVAGASLVPPYRLGLAAVRALLPRLLDPGRQVDLAILADRQAGAVALWLQGERAYRSMRFAQALRLYERAVALDSELVLAAVKGAQAASWEERLPEAGALAAYAVLRDSLLPHRYGLLARGILAYVHGRADSALAWFDSTVREAPAWAEALTARGEVGYHLFPSVSSPESLAAGAFEAAAAADPEFTPPALHLAQMALRRGDLPRTDRLLRRLHAAGADSDLVRDVELARRCAGGRLDAQDWLGAAAQDIADVLGAAKSLAVGGRHLACAEDGFSAALASNDRANAWGAFLGMQGVLAARGRLDALRRLVDSVATAGPRIAKAAYLLDALAGLPLDSEAAEVVSSLRQAFGDSLDALGFTTENAARTRWLVGAWYASRGQRDRAAILLAALERQHREAPSAAAERYARALAPHVALASGDTAGALAGFRALTPDAPRDELAWDLGSALAVERLRWAELALARGEPAEAHGVAAVLEHPGPIAFLPFLPASLELRLRAARAMGRNDLANLYRGRLDRLARQGERR